MGKYMTDEDWSKVKYFKKEEFKCGCGGRYCNGFPHPISKSMVLAMDDYRTICGATTITSGLRCQRYNDELEGSVVYSDHIVGQACDILTPNYLKGERTNIAKGLWNLKYTYTNEKNMYNAIHCSFNLYDYPEETTLPIPIVEDVKVVEEVPEVKVEVQTVTINEKGDNMKHLVTDIKERLKSPVVIAGLLTMLLNFLVGKGVISLGSEEIETVVSSISAILITFGLLNDPTKRKGF
jgi:uncharacterized membrane protein